MRVQVDVCVIGEAVDGVYLADAVTCEGSGTTALRGTMTKHIEYLKTVVLEDFVRASRSAMGAFAALPGQRWSVGN